MYMKEYGFKRTLTYGCAAQGNNACPGPVVSRPCVSGPCLWLNRCTSRAPGERRFYRESTSTDFLMACYLKALQRALLHRQVTPLHKQCIWCHGCHYQVSGSQRSINYYCVSQILYLFPVPFLSSADLAESNSCTILHMMAYWSVLNFEFH